MLERRENPARVLRLIAQAEGGVLFHCTAGKDRTGCIAALLLSLAGVELSDVLADYQMTELYIRETVRRIRREHPEAAASSAAPGRNIWRSLTRWRRGTAPFWSICAGWT